MTTWRIAALPGDGVGPEVTRAALRALEALASVAGVELVVREHPVGWSAVTASGSPLPDATREACLGADAILLGAVGDPAADSAPLERRPESGLLALRRALGCWANLRPVRVPVALEPASAVRPGIVRGTDLLIVRELGGGLYYGEPRGDDGERGWNTLVYRRHEVVRIAQLAAKLAAGRRGHITSVDKANVLESSRLWRRVATEAVGGARPEVDLEHMLVDRAALELILHPTRFDVVLTGNLFGDILSDAAAALAGSLGVLGSASLGGVTDLYEPVHGSAPDLAGTGRANPIGALASVGLLLRHTFGMDDLARHLERAIDDTLAAGTHTPDLAGSGAAPGRRPCSTEAFTNAVLERIHTPAGAHA